MPSQQSTSSLLQSLISGTRGVAAAILLGSGTVNSLAIAQDNAAGAPAEAPPTVEIKNASFQAGLKSLKENLPDVAINHFKKAIEAGPAKEQPWPQEQLVILQQFLAESYARAGKPGEAIELYSRLPLTPANNYWTSVALIQQGSLTRALHWLNQIPADDAEWYSSALQAKAYVADLLNDDRLLQSCLEQLVKSGDPFIAIRSRIWLANCLLEQKKTADAISALQPLVNPDNNADAGETAPAAKPRAEALKQLQPYIQLTQVRILGEQQKWDEAQAIVSKLAEDKDMPLRIKDLARIALASIEIKKEADENRVQAPSKTPAPETPQPAASTGEDQLIAFITARPNSPLLAEAFKILIRQRTFLTNPQALEKLTAWSNQSDQTRQPLASYALADTMFKKKDPEQALEIARKSLKASPENPATRKLVLETVNQLISEKKYDEASELIHTYPHKEAEIYFNSGIIAYEQKDYEEAAAQFDNAIKMAGDSMVREAYYNANLNALALGDESRMAALIKEAFLMPQLQETLAYEQAHYSAQNFEPQAIEKLQQFINLYPESRYRISAILDLAEVALNISPPRLDIAREQINALQQLKLSQEEAVRLACLNILVPESQQIWPDAIHASQEALRQFPHSRKAPAIRLKLGELYFKNENFNESLMVLQSFSKDYPNSSLKEEALFLAGKAAQHCDTDAMLDKALNIFQGISASNSRFSQAATIEYAAILQRLKRSSEAIATLQSLLNQKLSKQVRLLALSIQAEAWSAIGKDEDDAAPLQTARDLCTQILDTPNLMPSWRFSALSQRAQYAERAGDSDAALEDYYAILSYFPDVSNLSRRDWFWFYTAGFSALHILENKQDWEKALDLARKMSKTTGSRAREAYNIARRIQFEHFIWNDSGDEEFDALEQKFFAEPQQAEQTNTPATPAPSPANS